MIDILAPKPLEKAICARRETQRDLDCLNRQIAARASRQAITVKSGAGRDADQGSGSIVMTWLIAWPSNVGPNSTHSHTGWRFRSRSSTRSSIAVMRLFRRWRDRWTSNGKVHWAASGHLAATTSPRVAGLAICSLVGVHLKTDPCRTALLFAAV